MKKPMNPPAHSGAGLALILTFFIWDACFFAGVFWLSEAFPAPDGRPLLLLFGGAMALLCLFNRVAAILYANRRFDDSDEEREATLSAFRDKCRTDPAAALRRYSDMDAVPIAMLVLYILLSLGIMLSAGLCSSRWEGWCMLPMAAGAYLLFMPLYRLLEKPFARLHKKALVPADELPVLHEMARRAAAAVGIRGKVRIEVGHSTELSVSRFGSTYVVIWGVRLMAVCTEAETEALLIHAFSYHTDRKAADDLYRRYRLMGVGTARLRPATWAFDLFYSLADARFEWDYAFYQIAVAEYMAHRGRENLRRLSDPAVGLRAIAKSRAGEFFDYEIDAWMPDSFFSTPEPRRNMETMVTAAFRRALSLRYAFWQECMERESDGGRVSPPLLREERDMMGLGGLPLLGVPELPRGDTPYGADVTAAAEELDLRWFLRALPGYAAARQRDYLTPLAIVEEWEASDKNRPTTELSPVLNAYRDLNRKAEGEALCDAILATEENPFALAHALYFKGQCLLRRYDEEGVDYVYRSMDINKNYMTEGLESVEEFARLAGLSEIREANRRRAAALTEAHGAHQDGASTLRATDRLEPDRLEGDMLPDILSYMERVSGGHLEQVYLVRKVIGEDFATSAFVIYFTPGAPEKELRQAYEAIFNYLDAYPIDHQFSLFLYDRETERAVRRVEGSLVWSRQGSAENSQK